MFASLMEILTGQRSGNPRLDPSLTLNSSSHLPAGMSCPGAFTYTYILILTYMNNASPILT
jgi:hypothetical protein